MLKNNEKGEGIVAVFRAAVKTVINPGKLGKGFFKTTKKEKIEPEFLVSSGQKGPFIGRSPSGDDSQNSDSPDTSLHVFFTFFLFFYFAFSRNILILLHFLLIIKTM